MEVILLHGPSGTIHFASHTAGSIFGEGATLSKSSLLDRIHENDRERVHTLFTDATLHGDRVPPVTVRILRSDGEIRWVVLFTVAVKDSVGKVIELHSTLRDVTQQIVLRERLVERETLAHMTNVLAKVGGWYAEIDSGRLYWSDELRQIYEVDEQHAPFEFGSDLTPTDDRLAAFFTPEDLARMRAVAQQVVASNEPQTLELPMTTAKGHKRYVRIFMSVSFDGVGPKRIYGATQDITEIKQRESELTRLVRELTIQNDRLEEFGHLVSHQLRAPATNIASIVSLLDDTTDADEARSLVGKLGEAAELLRRTLDEAGNAIRVHRTVAPEVEPIYVRDVVLGIKTQLAQTFEDLGASLEIDTDEVPVVHYPRVYLETVLRHLISNALRFAQQGTPIIISVRSMLHEGLPVIEVSDTGVGIDLSKHGNRMFRLGTTFHRQASGRGLGLFMVRTIVESLGGEIDVESAPNQGTTFRLSLHRYRAEEAE